MTKFCLALIFIVGCTKDNGSSCDTPNHDQPDAGMINPLTACGDGTCQVDETLENCPQDCFVCGDGVCTEPETIATCARDCVVCGDGLCNGDETAATCDDDCTRCGDGLCTGGETITSCVADCSVCGDGMCTGDEATTCPQDCSGSVAIHNTSTYTIYYIYSKRCTDASYGPDLLGANVLASGSTFTLNQVPAGCWNFRANNSGATMTWTSPAFVLAAGATYTWTIIN